MSTYYTRGQFLETLQQSGPADAATLIIACAHLIQREAKGWTPWSGVREYCSSQHDHGDAAYHQARLAVRLARVLDRGITNPATGSRRTTY